ncbi:hypothetical protein GCM10009785_20280 [Brooklawnia cerclae]|uniref:Protein-disulfide isomerase n=1 Tax=Brooklawnia cerclae TaxID=349934 RepID=A0ABX0SFS0_9ACTN|nr:thioredoxin domain-containing protein [Brooklawnia cerclae]NIH57230.1 protein-disulfide isomerase [Brooklawnia cerclae]
MSKSKQNQPRQQADATNRDASAGTSRREQLRAQQLAEAKSARTRRIVTAAAIVVAVAIVVTVCVVLWQNHQTQKRQEELQSQADQIVPASANADQNGILVTGTASDATPLVQVYEDFQCPGCAQASAYVEPNLESLAEKGELRIEYHVLHGLDTSLGTTYSQKAAIAGSCAAEYGSFSDYATLVYANQPEQEGDGWTDEQLRETFAEQSGMTGQALTDFQACFDGNATSDFVDAMQNSRPDIVTATPSFVVNGQLVEFSTSDTEDQVLAKVQAVA